MVTNCSIVQFLSFAWVVNGTAESSLHLSARFYINGSKMYLFSQLTQPEAWVYWTSEPCACSLRYKVSQSVLLHAKGYWSSWKIRYQVPPKVTWMNHVDRETKL
jgi:hypothetical protein